MFRSDILFNGYYGQKNTGDDAFVEVTSWASNTIWKKPNIQYLAKKNNLPNTLYAQKAYPFSLPKTYKPQQNLLINNTEVFVSAGGSTFHSELKEDNAKFIALQRKQNGTKNFKIGAIGVSLGPFKSVKDEKSISNYLKNLNFLTLRDKRSHDFATSLNLPYNPVDSFDMAALLPSIYGLKELRNNVKTVGVSLCNFERFSKGDLDNEVRRNRKLSQLLKELDAKEKIHFKFFIINGNPVNGDRNLTIETIAKCKLRNSYEIVEYNKTTREIWNEIASCDFMISTRLHGAIFACFANTPFILVEYHQKCHDFLDDIGFDAKLRVYDMEVDLKKTTLSILDIINDHSNYNFPTYITQMKEKALLNFTTIDL